MATPRGPGQLAECLRVDPALRVLGDGANLLVADEGVRELVISLSAPAFTSWDIDAATGLVRVGAGANLPKLINECVRRGLAGIEGLAGIPASIGGALVMNAGGAFGQIADVVERVCAVDRAGRGVVLERDRIGFSYRHSGLNDLVLVSAELRLTPADAAAIRARQKEVMAYKSRSQPMADKSAGCVFKNPILTADLDGVGPAGQRASAGMLIDRAGCKGLKVRGAEVSPRHANFVVTHAGARAGDVIELMDTVRRRVQDRFGVALEPEVVIWRRTP
ncbi:MAG: UDP-N-acetylmuramate dehydrogenase [Phycisphaerales bacterium]|nr:UDP-N-acetylmuramate dehydrogenase [Phycisphaerales bacterium]